jgi:hypothetical protein
MRVNTTGFRRPEGEYRAQVESTRGNLISRLPVNRQGPASRKMQSEDELWLPMRSNMQGVQNHLWQQFYPLTTAGKPSTRILVVVVVTVCCEARSSRSMRIGQGYFASCGVKPAGGQPPLANYELAQIRASGCARPHEHTRILQNFNWSCSRPRFFVSSTTAQRSGKRRPPDSRFHGLKASAAPVDEISLEVFIADILPLLQPTNLSRH